MIFQYTVLYTTHVRSVQHVNKGTICISQHIPSLKSCTIISVQGYLSFSMSVYQDLFVITVISKLL